MTAQISDEIIFNGVQYSIAAKKGGSLFGPRAHGISPVGVTSCCWRGYQCVYSVQSDRLVLAILTVCHSNIANARYYSDLTDPPDINSVTARALDVPQPGEGPLPMFPHEYRDLGLLVQFSGEILAANSFIMELYLHGGFHPAWKYEKNLELKFENGLLTSTRDVSDIFKEFRHTFVTNDEGWPQCTPEDDARSWLKTVSLDYAYDGWDPESDGPIESVADSAPLDQ